MVKFQCFIFCSNKLVLVLSLTQSSPSFSGEGGGSLLTMQSYVSLILNVTTRTYSRKIPFEVLALKRRTRIKCGLPVFKRNTKIFFPSFADYCFAFLFFKLLSDCYYDGILHEHGERWSPGPCTPECKCDDGKIRCTLIECPELSCSNPIKKRWKCCPECPVEEGSTNSA